MAVPANPAEYLLVLGCTLVECRGPDLHNEISSPDYHGNAELTWIRKPLNECIFVPCNVLLAVPSSGKVLALPHILGGCNKLAHPCSLLHLQPCIALRTCYHVRSPLNRPKFALCLVALDRLILCYHRAVQHLGSTFRPACVAGPPYK